MPFWVDLLRWLGFLRDHESLHFDLDEPHAMLLYDLAERERRSPQALANTLLADALETRRLAELSLQHWESLSPREQEVAALICLNYTNRQIAARLGLSPETVKTHAHNLMVKFELRTRAELRRALAGWNFSAWE